MNTPKDPIVKSEIVNGLFSFTMHIIALALLFEKTYCTRNTSSVNCHLLRLHTLLFLLCLGELTSTCLTTPFRRTPMNILKVKPRMNKLPRFKKSSTKSFMTRSKRQRLTFPRLSIPPRMLRWLRLRMSFAFKFSKYVSEFCFRIWPPQTR